MKLRIATRESRLALWQAEHVATLLRGLGHDVELRGMTTRGDQILDRSLSKVGGKGLFVKELETALHDGSADLAVHSLKDVPMVLPDGFVLAAVMTREDPRDAWVSNQFASLAELPLGAVVGTSSLRRHALIRSLRPDLRIEALRGNLDTRLRKLDAGDFAAIVLAAAGLIRLGMPTRIRAVFGVDELLPAAGQGALGIEVLASRSDVLAAVAALNDQATALATHAEREVSRSLGGSCSVPLAAHAVWSGPGDLLLRAAWADAAQLESTSIEGQRTANSPATCGASGPVLLRAQVQDAVTDEAAAAALGRRVASLLIERGASCHGA